MSRFHRKLLWLSCAWGRNNIAASRVSAKGDWKKLIPGLAVSLVCLVVIFYLIDLDKFVQVMRQARLWVLVAGGLLSLPWLLVRAAVWRTLLRRKAAYRDVFLTINEGYLLNNLLPFRLGEVGRVYLLGRKTGLGFWQVLPTILVERALDLMLASGLFLSMLLFVVGVSWAQQAALVTAIIVAAGLLALYLVARNQPLILRLLQRLAQGGKLGQKLAGRQAYAFLDGLAVLTDTPGFLTAVALIVLNWAINICQYYVILLAFFPDARLLWAAFALGAAALGIAAPSSPGALGVFEAVLVGALAAFGVEPSGAAAFAISLHFIQYVATGVFGVYALVMDGMSLGGLYRELGQIRHEGTS